MDLIPSRLGRQDLTADTREPVMHNLYGCPRTSLTTSNDLSVMYEDNGINYREYRALGDL